MGYHSRTGLIVLKRRVNLTLDRVFGTTREEFVRLLVIDEKGVHNASMQVSDMNNFKVKSIKARTVKPDGSVIKADKTRDIHMTEVKKFKRSKPLLSLAKVNFPAVGKGAILDLHFVIHRDGMGFFYVDAICPGGNPSLKTDYTIHINGGFPGTHWSVILLGGRSGTGRLESKGKETVEAHFGILVPREEEPDSVPFYQRKTALLLYLNFENNNYHANKVTSKSFSVDPRGRLADFSWFDAPLKDWWFKQVWNNEEYAKKFIKHPGKAKRCPVLIKAPKTMPLEKRLKILYEYAQDRVGYNPDATELTNLSHVMRKGENSTWQGTYFFSYLLERAGIPFTRALIVNRYGLRFSPQLASTYLYDMADAVMVKTPGHGRMFFMPGKLDLPFGCLPVAYQDSLAFRTLGNKKEKRLTSCFTPMNAQGVDETDYSYEAKLDENGDVSGTMVMTKTGEPAAYFSRWYRYRAFREKHPKRSQKKKRLSTREKADNLSKHLRWEVEPPGPMLDYTHDELKQVPEKAVTPLKIACSFTGKSIARHARGNTWLLYAFPMLSGYKNPFVQRTRGTPVWYGEGGHVVMDGYIKLPAGAKVVDLPQPATFSGPNRTKISVKVETVHEDGATAIHSRIEYDQPLVVGYDKYRAWKAYQAFVAEEASSRCVITFPSTKEFE